MKKWLPATAVAAVLASALGAPTAAAAPPGWHGLGWDLPALQHAQLVPGRTGAPKTLPNTAVPSAKTPTVTWPAAASAVVDLPATTAGTAVPAAKAAAGTPASVARSVHTGQRGAGQVKVATADHAAVARAGAQGTLLKVSPATGDTSGPISVSVDYRSFAGAYGADYGSRLRLVQYPLCVLTSPDKPGCSAPTPLESTNDAKAGRVTGDVALPVVNEKLAASDGGAVVGVASGTNSGGGDFTATNLPPAGTWTSGGSAGDFSYAYPITMPNPPGGKAPDVALNYSSASMDGLSSASNNQPSLVGDGWSLGAGGFIERSYKACAQALGGNNGQTKTGDLCWNGVDIADNINVAFGSSSGPLVLDKASNTWHPKKDDGSRIEKFGNATNGTSGDEYWKITAKDGSQYFFGLNHLPGWQQGNAETQSKWTVPVFGNFAGQPCNKPTFAASSCAQAWRWNLDLAIDPHGNATTYYYTPETNYYGLNVNYQTPGTAYTRGGFLNRIEYGLNTQAGGLYATPTARVVFDTGERCLPSGNITCAPDQLTKDNAKSWPDVPADQLCAQGAVCRNNLSPAFFTRARLAAITTQVTNGSGGWTPVNRWDLTHSFPGTGDGSSPAMWLSSITRTGLAGGSLALPPTSFVPQLMANRVNVDQQYTALTRNRLVTIVDSRGGVTTVKYSDPQCAAGIAPQNNTNRCYPAYWTPGGAKEPVLDWFNKYVVTDITEDGGTTLAKQVHTHYDYEGAAWHYDENIHGDAKYRTWNEWRGYATVTTTKGSPEDPAGPPTVTKTAYLQGMDGDTFPDSDNLPKATRSVRNTDSLGEEITDSKELDGFVRETQTLLDGKVIGTALNDPWITTTGTDADGVQSAMTSTSVVRTRVFTAATGQWRTARKTTAFTSAGLPAQVEETGDVTDPKQMKCTRTTYAQDTGTWLLDYPKQITTISGPCADPNQANATNIVADLLNYYDHRDFGAAPVTGNITRTDNAVAWAPNGAEQFQAPSTTTDYDTYGREKAKGDAAGNITTIAYTPAIGGPLTKVATTTPPVVANATPPVTFTSYKTYDPVSGVLTSETDNSGLRTDATYDPLARTKAVWKPMRDRPANSPADGVFTYTDNTTTPSVIATGTLQSNGGYTTAYELHDGLGRTVQKQEPTSYKEGGRTVTDTFYDSQGQVWQTHDPYWNKASGPSGTLLVVDENVVPSTTRKAYDSAGQEVRSAFRRYDQEQWATTTVYDGDRVTTIPPKGGTASTVVSDGSGRKTQFLQYKDPTRTGPGAAADVTTYTYNLAGELTSTTDPTGKNVWTTQYDLLGRRTAATDPDTGNSTFMYDTADQLASTTDGRGRVLSYTYDNLGRRTAEFDGPAASGTKIAAWDYDTLLKGLPTDSVRYVDGKAYTSAKTGYTATGQPSGMKLTVPTSETGLGGTYQFNYTYDPLTQAVQTATSPGKGGLPDETMTTLYDPLGKPGVLYATNTSGTTTTLVSETDYNPFGQVLRLNYQDKDNPNQVSTTNTYRDGTNQLWTTLSERATTTGHQIANRTYDYDPGGNITRIADTPLDATADVQCYANDYRQRLAEAWTPASGDCATPRSGSALGGAAPYWESWTYDAAGNRATQTQHGPGGDVVSTSGYPLPGQNQPHALQNVSTKNPDNTTSQTSYSYDTGGNTITRNAGGAQTLTYDAEGRVATSTDAAGKKTTYVYDADGGLMVSTDPTGKTLYVGDLELFVAAGTTTASGTRSYKYNKQEVADRTTSGLTWLLADYEGTANASVNADTLAVTQRRQDPFGNPRGTAPASWPNKRGFMAGQQLTAGLVQMGHREYDPAIGRFISADPLLDARNPQQMNGYAYANNDPVTITDKNGLFPAKLLNDERGAQQLWWDRADFQKQKQMPARMRNNEKMLDEITWDRGKAARDQALAYLQAFDDVMNNPAIRKLLGKQWDMEHQWKFTGDTASCKGASYGEGLAMGASFCTNDQDGRKYTSDRNGIGVGFSITTDQTVYSYVRNGHEGEKGSLYSIYISFKLGVGPATFSVTVSADLDGNHMTISGSKGLRLNQITPEKFAQALSDPVALLKPNANAEVGLSIKIPDGSSPCQVPAALKYGGCNPR